MRSNDFLYTHHDFADHARNRELEHRWIEAQIRQFQRQGGIIRKVTIQTVPVTGQVHSGKGGAFKMNGFHETDLESEAQLAEGV